MVIVEHLRSVLELADRRVALVFATVDAPDDALSSFLRAPERQGHVRDLADRLHPLIHVPLGLNIRLHGHN